MAVGGMAVIEGVMMRADRRWAVAARRPDGGIETIEGATPGWCARVERVPLVRGFVALAESLTLGSRALGWSAALQEGNRSEDFRAPRRLLATGALAALALFVLIPAAIAAGLSGPGRPVVVVEALARLAILGCYLVAIRRIPDVRRVFAYHGAEHMAVASYEAGRPLTVGDAAGSSTRHERCGTTFLLMVIGVATVVHAFVGHPPLVLLLASRLVLVPFVAGVAYELMRMATLRSWWCRPARVLVAPGMWLQRLTTAPPDHDQLEVALVALRMVLPSLEDQHQQQDDENQHDDAASDVHDRLPVMNVWPRVPAERVA